MYLPNVGKKALLQMRAKKILIRLRMRSLIRVLCPPTESMDSVEYIDGKISPEGIDMCRVFQCPVSQLFLKS